MNFGKFLLENANFLFESLKGTYLTAKYRQTANRTVNQHDTV